MHKCGVRTKVILTVLIVGSLFLSYCGTKGGGSVDGSADFNDIRVGMDYTDLSARLNLVTNRTDLIRDTREGMEFPDYIEEFNRLYPDILITVDGITDYDSDMGARLSSGSWGDICCIPSTVAASDYSDYFEPIGDLGKLNEKYEFADKTVYDDVAYGLPLCGNVEGIIYNKRIWKEAGINGIPVTPDEFIADLKLINENTDAIPLYTNYEAVWPLGIWDSYLYSCSTGDAKYKNYTMPYEKEPFSRKADGTGPYEVFSILYRAVSEGLTEEDPETTSWELSKGAMNRGEIATMVLGSWAVSQIKGADLHPEDIGYMPFPISVKGVQYSVASGDYSYGINNRSAAPEKLAAKIFLKYMIEISGYAVDQGSIPVVKGGKYPDDLKSFEKTKILKNIMPDGKDGEGLFEILNKESGLMFNSDSTHVMHIIDSALNKEETFDDIMDEWNHRWNEVQDRHGIEAAQ